MGIIISGSSASGGSNAYTDAKIAALIGAASVNGDTLVELEALIALKENIIAAGTSGQYWAGTKTWVTLDKTAVGLANVDNTSDVNKPTSTAQAASIASAVSTHVGLADPHTQYALDTDLAAKQANIQIKDEGVAVGSSGGITTIDFVGTGVSVSNAGAVATVTISGGGGGGGTPIVTGIATVDFGATPTDEASVTVTGLSSLSVGSHKKAYIQSDDTTTDNTANAHHLFSYWGKVTCEYLSSTSMIIKCNLLIGLAKGTFKVHYEII